MQITITVVDFDGQRWFQLRDGLMFDTLHACWEFNHQELLVMRGEEVIDRAWVKEARGDVVFDSGRSDDRRVRGSALHAENFQSDERLIVDVPHGFDLAANLRQQCQFQDAVVATMPVGKKMTLDEAETRLTPELDRTRGDYTNSQILRFRTRSK